MITRVHLENWRAYKSFDIDLAPGTTFLVAPNGVGKSSFIEAIQWALNADAQPIRTAMRRRAKTTTVEVNVSVENRTVRIKRILTVGRGKSASLSTEAWVDDEVADPESALLLLADAWKVDNRFACRAAFLTDRLIDRDPDPDLRSHLARLHSLDNIQQAISSLGAAMKATSATADAARKATRASDADLQQRIAEAAEAAKHLDMATAESETLRNEAAMAKETLNQAVQFNEEHRAHREWAAARAALADEIEALLGTRPEELDLRPVLRVAEASANQQLMEVSEQRARLLERLSSIEDSVEQLHQAGGVCPVCRRPLDDQSREYAEQQHENDRLRAEQQLEAVDTDASSTLGKKLKLMLGRAGTLGEPPPEPTGEPVDLDPLEANAAAVRVAFEKSLEDVGHAHHAAADANAVVEAIEIERAQESSTDLYATVAALEAATAALEATVTRVLESQLGPVSEEVNRRWEAIFPDRPGLRLDSTGRIARTFDDDEESDLEFESFSSGEQVVAKILLRLATLTSTTEIPFCFIDEPLEHLDPDARSYVARTLAYLATADGLNQIVVTTYEQALALQLASIAREQVDLEFLTTAHVAP